MFIFLFSLVSLIIIIFINVIIHFNQKRLTITLLTRCSFVNRLTFVSPKKLFCFSIQLFFLFKSIDFLLIFFNNKKTNWIEEPKVVRLFNRHQSRIECQERSLFKKQDQLLAPFFRTSTCLTFLHHLTFHLSLKFFFVKLYRLQQFGTQKTTYL